MILLDAKGYYGVRVVNGKMSGAGTNNNDVYVCLVGTKACTGKVPLMSSLEFIKGGIDSNTHLDVIVETDESIGDVQVVILDIDDRLAFDNSWFVNYTIVYDFFKDKAEIEFPCYHWIKGGETITTTAKTSKHVNEED